MRSWLLAVLIFGLLACDNSVKVEVRTDSLKQKLDTSLEQIKDSAKAKGDRTLEKLKQKVNDLTDEDSTRINLK